jgi:hypothetical protein
MCFFTLKAAARQFCSQKFATQNFLTRQNSRSDLTNLAIVNNERKLSQILTIFKIWLNFLSLFTIAKLVKSDREFWRVKKFCVANFCEQNCRAAAFRVKKHIFWFKILLEVPLSFFFAKGFILEYGLKIALEKYQFGRFGRIKIFEFILRSLN